MGLPSGILRASACIAALALLPAAASAANVVHVRLVDPSTGPSVKTMAILADAATVRTGRITFDVTNDSKAMVHEMILVAVDSFTPNFPYDKAQNIVEEDKIKDLGEASEMQPGERKSLTMRLAPGDYMLICNQPDHYHVGMHANLVVTK